MDRLEFLTDFLNGFSEDTLHLVGLGLGLLGSIVGIWAKIAQIRHKKKLEQQGAQQIRIDDEMKSIQARQTQLTEDSNKLQVAMAGSVKLDPQLGYKVHQTQHGIFLTLHIAIQQLGAARVRLLGLSIDVDVLEIIDGDLLLNGMKQLKLRVGSMAENIGEDDEESIDHLSFIPDNQFWLAIVGPYAHSRSKECDIPIQTSGSGLFSFTITLQADEIDQNGEPIDDSFWSLGGETLVGSIG